MALMLTVLLLAGTFGTSIAEDEEHELFRDLMSQIESNLAGTKVHWKGGELREQIVHDADKGTIDLEVRAVRHIEQAIEFTSRSFSGGKIGITMSGPTVTVSPGKILKLRLINNNKPLAKHGRRLFGGHGGSGPNPLLGHINIHTHGLHNSAVEDDVCVDIAPGTTHLYAYPLIRHHYPGVHWYHAHFHGMTAYAVMGGIVGALIVKDTQKVHDYKSSLLLIQNVYFKQEDGDIVQEDPKHAKIVSGAKQGATEQENVLCHANCKGLEDGRYQDCDSCYSYLQCQGGKAFYRHCPPNFFYRHASYTCLETSYEKEFKEECDGKGKPLLSAGSLSHSFGDIHTTNNKDPLKFHATVKAQLPETMTKDVFGGRFIGWDYLLVNGQYQPYINMKVNVYHVFRIIVATAKDFLELEIHQNGKKVPKSVCAIWRFGNDGIYFDKEREVGFIFFSPGARADVAVKCTKPGTYVVGSYPDASRDNAIGTADRFRQDHIFTLKVAASKAKPSTGPVLKIPTKPDYLQPLPAKGATQVHVRYYDGTGMATSRDCWPGADDKVVWDHSKGCGNHMDEFTMNHVYEWLLNTDGVRHPHHQHVNPMQVFVNDKYTHPDISFPGMWADVFPTIPNTVLRWRPTRFTGNMIVHCHFLEHEDFGMMSSMGVNQDPSQCPKIPSSSQQTCLTKQELAKCARSKSELSNEKPYSCRSLCEREDCCYYPGSQPKCLTYVQKVVSAYLPRSVLRATSSSTLNGGVARRVIDGSASQVWKGGSCQHTKREKQPHVRINLGSVRLITGIEILGRVDCCACRSQKLDVKVLPASHYVAKNVNAAGYGGAHVTVANVLGSSIEISRDFTTKDCDKAATGWMNLCEVKVAAGMVLKYPKKWPHCTNLGRCFKNKRVVDAVATCLANPRCDGFSFSSDMEVGNGCYKTKCHPDWTNGYGHTSHGYYEKPLPRKGAVVETTSSNEDFESELLKELAAAL